MNETLFPILALFGLLLSIARCSQAQPYGANGFQGRIALSHDGNFNDEDDWGAFPVAVAILDALGVKERTSWCTSSTTTSFRPMTTGSKRK